jgi:hypothetical protein
MGQGHMKFHAQTIARSFNTQLLGAVAAAAIMLAPVCAYAQSAADGPLRSWLDMVSASQAAQPSWMTPLVTVTPRLEQEFRWDFYDQQKVQARRATANALSIMGDQVVRGSN